MPGLFEKKPKCFQPIELDYGEEELSKAGKAVAPGTKSKLDDRVQFLVQTIFNVDLMKQAMLEMEIDLNKMPLGTRT